MKKILIALLSLILAASAATVCLAGTLYTNDRLRIRKTPSTSGEIVDVVPVNTKIDVIGNTDDGWAKISYKGQTCYVKAEYLSATKTVVSESAAEKKTASEAKTSDGTKTSAETKTVAETSASAESKTEAGTKTAAEDKSKSAASVSAGKTVSWDPSWKYADFSAINSGTATLYKATANRKGKVIGVNAGHGTSGGGSVKTWCHPDKTPKVTGGTTAAGSTKSTAVSGGMSFSDGTAESKVTLREAVILKDMLLAAGYDVLMLRESDDVQLDNVARTVICNNLADCHIALHWDGDGLDYDKGCFYSSVPDGIKYLETVGAVWEKSEKLGDCLIKGLADKGNKIRGTGSMDIDLTQTSFSTIPSVDVELGNQSSDHSDAKLRQLAGGLLAGINTYFGY